VSWRGFDFEVMATAALGLLGRICKTLDGDRVGGDGRKRRGDGPVTLGRAASKTMRDVAPETGR
jgi:hypothetical protein